MEESGTLGRSVETTERLLGTTTAQALGDDEPYVEYTFANLVPPPPPARGHRPAATDLAKKRAADARMRRAMRDAWADPESSRRHLDAAAQAYAALSDDQGLAYVYFASADCRRAAAHMGKLSGPLEPVGALTDNLAARTGYAKGLQLLGGLAASPERAAAYDVRRSETTHDAMRSQARRPVPVGMDADDVTAAFLGGDEVSWWRPRAKSRFHTMRSGSNPLLSGDGRGSDHAVARGGRGAGAHGGLRAYAAGVC